MRTRWGVLGANFLVRDGNESHTKYRAFLVRLGGD
jgi:hypothetical protein